MKKLLKKLLRPIIIEIINEVLYDKVEKSINWYAKNDGVEIISNKFFEEILKTTPKKD